MYAEYEFYTGTYGGVLSESVYARLEPKAEAYLQYFTYPNGDIFAAADVEAIQKAVCAAVECIAENTAISAKTGAYVPDRVIRSENNDGYSVNYADTRAVTSAEAALRRKVLDVVRIYLLPTGWLSRKVGCCCVD